MKIFRASANCSKILNDKKIYSIQWIQDKLFSGKVQVAQKSWMIKNISIQWKIFRANCFSGQAQIAQKSWVIKNIYSMQWIQGKLCFSEQAQVSQKSWMVKIYSIQWWVSRQTLFFSAKWKKFNTLIGGSRIFLGAAQGRVHPDVYWLHSSEDPTAQVAFFNKHCW